MKTKLDGELTRRTVDALGVETNYYIAGEGNGRFILLLHGMTASGDAYRELMVALADEYCLIAPDLPGFGLSAMSKPYRFSHLVEWVAAFRDALDLPACPLVGHSFGGALATRYAIAHPEDVTRLVLLAPALLSRSHIPKFVMKTAIALGVVDVAVAISQSPRLVPYVVKSPFYDSKSQPQSVWERRLRDYDHARASAAAIKAIAAQDPRQNLDQVACPICMIWGNEDAVVPVAHVDVLMGIWPAAALTRLDGCGHVLVQEKTAVVIQTTRTFLQES